MSPSGKRLPSDRSRTRWLRLGVPLSVAVAAVVFAPLAAAAPGFDLPVLPGTKYVALGSSFAAGPGLSGIYDAPCGKSENNYPHRVASALSLDLTDATCGGATIDNIVDTAQPLAAGPRPPQIDAVTADTGVVTITIGGNDANYQLDLFRNSCTPPNDPAVPDAVEPLICTTVDPAKTQAALDGLEAEMVAMVGAVQAKAPNARILLVDYLTVLPASGQPCAGLPVTEDEADYSLNVASRLAAATKSAANKTGAELIELSKISAGHDACSTDPWVFGWEFDPLFFINGGVIAYHPNNAGTQVAADQVTRQLSSFDLFPNSGSSGSAASR